MKKRITTIGMALLISITATVINGCKKKETDTPTPAAVVIPTVTSLGAVYVTGTSGTLQGSITNTGNGTITSSGFCFGPYANPNFSSTVYLYTGSGTSINILLTGLTAHTTYHARAFATNSAGTGFGNDITITTYTIGQSYGGGIIFQLAGDGNHGLIAATADIGTGGTATITNWGCTGVSINTGTAVGTGMANMIAIVNGCSLTTNAAGLCNTYGLATEQWYLPSKDELTLMYQQASVIGGFDTFSTSYWSSSQYDAANAWQQAFYGSGTPSYAPKEGLGSSGKVRPIRSF